MGVRHAPILELFPRPFIRGLELGRTGEARPDHVGELPQGFHDLGVGAEGLIANFLDGGVVDLLFGEGGGRDQGNEGRGG